MRVVVIYIGLLIVGCIDAFAQEPDIAVTPEAFDYETVAIGTSRDRAFAVSNEDTTANLIVFAIEIQGEDADQFRITGGGGGVVLAPGGIRLVTVRFTPTSIGVKRAILRIASDDPDETPFDVALSGTGQGFSDISVNRTTLAFGSLFIGSTDSLDLIVSNQGLADLDVTATEFAGMNADLFDVDEGVVPFTLAPQARDTLRIRFTPSSDGDKSALLRLFNNDPNENPLEILLTGRGVSSDIMVDSTRHDFGEVALGESALHTFLIANEGTATLVVDSLELQGPGADQFRVTGGGPPFTLGVNRTRSLTVQFVPARDGPQSAVLALFSNDPDTPQLTLSLGGTTLAPRLVVSAVSLDFGELLTGLDTTQTVLLTNPGRANLAVSQTVIAGGDSTAFVLESRRAPFSLAPSDSLRMTVRFTPTSAGPKTSALRLVSNDLDQPEVVIPLSALASTLDVDVVPVAAFGEDVTLTVTLPEGFEPDAATLFYRGAGETTFRTTDLVATGPDFRGTIPGLAVTLRGIEYYARIAAGDRAVTAPAFDPVNQPLFLPVQIDQLEAPVSPQLWTYQMISVPLDLAEPDVAAVLEDDYDRYNTRRWRLFRWEEGDYVEYPAIQGTFTAGVGFWLITNDGSTFDVENGRSIDPSEPFVFTLEPGWNQIGNPYAFSIAWPGSVLDPRIEAPVAYDGVEFQYDQTDLRPWEGYFVRNLASAPITVSLPARPSAVRKQGDLAGKLAEVEGLQYLLRLSADVAGTPLRDTQNYLGLLEGAHDGHDAFDFTEAPPIGEHVRLSLVERGERYAGNFKLAREGGQHWDLEVAGTAGDRPVRVTLTGTGQLPEAYALFVLDQDHRTAIAIVDSSFSIEMNEAFPVRRLRFLIGTTAYADAYGDGIPLVPIADHLGQNYPNPFNPETTIRYQVSRPSPVRLEIYTLTGQRVRTLVDATQDAGAYTVRWDGRNEGGVSVASGVYLYRLRADAFSATKRMVLIR